MPTLTTAYHFNNCFSFTITTTTTDKKGWNKDLKNAHPQAVFKDDGSSVNCTVCATFLAKGSYIVPSQSPFDSYRWERHCFNTTRHAAAVEAQGSRGPKQSTILPFIVRHAKPGAQPLVRLLLAKKPTCCEGVPPDALAVSSAMMMYGKYMKPGLMASHHVGRIGKDGPLTIYAQKCSDIGIKRNRYGRCCDICYELRKNSWKDNLKRKITKAETSFRKAAFALRQATITVDLANDLRGIVNVAKIHLTDVACSFRSNASKPWSSTRRPWGSK
jgi:hypothetical protein